MPTNKKRSNKDSSEKNDKSPRKDAVGSGSRSRPVSNMQRRRKGRDDDDDESGDDHDQPAHLCIRRVTKQALFWLPPALALGARSIVMKSH